MKLPGALDPREFIATVPGPVDRAKALAHQRFDDQFSIKKCIQSDSLAEWCEVIVSSVVDESRIELEDEHLGIQEWNDIFADLLTYGCHRCASPCCS